MSGSRPGAPAPMVGTVLRLLPLVCALVLAPAGAAHADALLPPPGQRFAGITAGDPASFQAQTGAHAPVVQQFVAWGSEGIEHVFRSAEDNRSRLMIHVSTSDGPAARELITPRAIARGEGDGYLLFLNRRFARAGRPAYIRLTGRLPVGAADRRVAEPARQPARRLLARRRLRGLGRHRLLLALPELRGPRPLRRPRPLDPQALRVRRVGAVGASTTRASCAVCSPGSRTIPGSASSCTTRATVPAVPSGSRATPARPPSCAASSPGASGHLWRRSGAPRSSCCPRWWSREVRCESGLVPPLRSAADAGARRGRHWERGSGKARRRG